MNIHEKLAEINMALFGIQITKSGFNKHKGFRYHELEDMILPVTKECYSRRLGLEFPYADGVAILKIVNLDDPNEYLVYRLTFPELVVEEKNPNNKMIQAYGADITYLQRYLLKLAFPCLTDKDIVDSDTGEDVKHNVASSAKTSEPETADINVGLLIVDAEKRLKKKGLTDAEITPKAIKREVRRLKKWSPEQMRTINNYFKEKEGF